jgi:putative intracellular protease/amidase
MAKILFVVTGSGTWTLADGSSHPTGFWADEVVAPYRVFTAAGHGIEVATPGGVEPPVDRASLAPEVNGGADGADAVLSALSAISALQRPRAVEEADASEYGAVFYPGGHGPMEDLASHAGSARLLTAAMESGRPLGLVCHGPAAVLATEGGDGSPFAGMRMTGFTDEEEAATGLADRAPWLLQDRLKTLGVDFVHGPAWEPFVVSDRNVHTGQNPASSAPLATRMLQTLE